MPASTGETVAGIEGARALVTGASTGIGRAIARGLAGAGAEVCLTARSRQGLDETLRTIVDRGGSASTHVADLTDEADIDRLAGEAGEIEILVHAAGVWHDDTSVFAGTPLVDTPRSQVREVVDVSLVAAMMLTQALLPGMLRGDGGKILGISGTFGDGGAGWLHYYTAKLGLEHFLVGLSQELRPANIQVNCVSPSDTATPALKRFFPEDAETALDPDEVADLALYLLSPAASHLTGQTIVIKDRDA